MAISYLVNHRARLVRTTYVGRIGLIDVAIYARELDDRKLLPYAQLIDASRATLALSSQDLRIFATLMATLRSRHGRGPVAVVPGNAGSYRVARLYRQLGAGANPRFAILTDVAAAEAWLAIEAQKMAEADGDAQDRAKRSS
jgi:hypothetical protein